MRAKTREETVHDESLAFLSKHLFKEPRRRHDVIHRKVLNMNTEVTVVKTTWNSFCRKEAQLLAVDDVLFRVNKAIAEAYLLANLHVTRLCSSELVLPALNQTFFYQCLSAVTSSRQKKPEPKSLEFRSTLALYRSWYPADYIPADGSNLASGFFQQASQQMATACKNSTSTNFYRRFHRYLKLKYNLDGKTAYDTLKSVHATSYGGTDDIVLCYRNLMPEKPKYGSIEDSPELVMPLQYRFLTFFQNYSPPNKHKSPRLFSLLPTKQSFTCNHVKMCTNGLYGLLKKSGVTGLPGEGPAFRAVGELYWRRFFKISDFETANRRFAGEILMDGKGVSIVMRKPHMASAPQQPHPIVVGSEERWGLDPGRRDLFVASNQHGQVHRCSTRQFYQEAGYRFSARKIHTWHSRDEEVREAIGNMPSKKTCDVSKFEHHIQFVLPRLDMLIRFHMRHGFRDLKFKRYVMAQKKLKQICKELTRCSGRSTTVGFGDWSNKDDAGIIRKCPAGPVKRLQRHLSHYCHVVPVDEFRTSKLHERCHMRLEPAFIHKHNKKGQAEYYKRVKVHSVLFCRGCKSCNGMTVNRDVNASRNMLRLLEAGSNRPEPFKRCLPCCTLHGSCRGAGGETPPLSPDA